MINIKSLRPRKINVNPKSFRKFSLIVVSILVAIVGFTMITRPRTTPNTNESTSNSLKVSEAKKTLELNQTFEFPIIDNDGDEISKMKYTLESAELRDEIIVKGQKATSISGRVFLVLNIKITNDLDKRLEITTRDYVRLSINDSGERLAFNVHNDPVQVDAISTKPTRLALPINDIDGQKLTLYVGEISGDKQPVELSF